MFNRAVCRRPATLGRHRGHPAARPYARNRQAQALGGPIQQDLAAYMKLKNRPPVHQGQQVHVTVVFEKDYSNHVGKYTVGIKLCTQGRSDFAGQGLVPVNPARPDGRSAHFIKKWACA